MADFVKKTWSCGDTITAEDLNRLEGGVEEALSEGGGDPGYSCTEETTLLIDESVTTTYDELSESNFGFFQSSVAITADTIVVTFDGQEYICSAFEDDGSFEYGASEEEGIYDWSQYPFHITSGEGGESVLDTESAGTYSVKVESYHASVEPTPCFDAAVKKVIDSKLPLLLSLVNVEDAEPMLDMTWDEISARYSDGQIIRLRTNSPLHSIVEVAEPYIDETDYKCYVTTYYVDATSGQLALVKYRDYVATVPYAYPVEMDDNPQPEQPG